MFVNGESAESLGLDGTEIFDISGVANSVQPASRIEVKAVSNSGKITKFEVLVRIDTEIENQYYRHGGLLPYILRQMMSEAR